MTPDKHLINVSDHIGNLPWYAILLGFAGQKVKDTTLGIVVTILLAIITALAAFTTVLVSKGVENMTSQMNQVVKSQTESRSEIKDLGKQVNLNNQKTSLCLQQLDNTMRILHPHTKIPRLGGGEFGNE